MNTASYKNLSELSYGELLTSLNHLKANLQNTDLKDQPTGTQSYYAALVEELDKRQREIL